MTQPTSILITGASSGIGAGLARYYAASGVHLFLGGRDAARLQAVAQDCEQLGAIVNTEVQDVTDQQAMQAWVERCDEEKTLELVIANAGISASTGAENGETSEHIRSNFAVNLDGVLNTVLPALDLMVPRKQGQVALMSSVMGFRGIPNGASYSGSKAAVRVLGEGMRGTFANRGIKVSVILPAMVATPMTDALTYNRGAIPTEKAASIIAGGLKKNKPRIGFTKGSYFMFWLLGCLPSALTDRVFRAKVS